MNDVFYNVIEITKKSDKILRAQVTDPEKFVNMMFPGLSPNISDQTYMDWHNLQGETVIEAVPVRDLILNTLISEEDYDRFMDNH